MLLILSSHLKLFGLGDQRDGLIEFLQLSGPSQVILWLTLSQWRKMSFLISFPFLALEFALWSRFTNWPREASIKKPTEKWLTRSNYFWLFPELWKETYCWGSFSAEYSKWPIQAHQLAAPLLYSVSRHEQRWTHHGQ